MGNNVKIIIVVGARPNFMKIAPIMTATKASGVIESLLVHTGQHYDDKMSDLFFHQLDIPEPDFNLEVGSNKVIGLTRTVLQMPTGRQFAAAGKNPKYHPYGMTTQQKE